ncbi:hypothetical protein [Salinispora mooreana]|uniref:hypothetical protein n=1 Tax=Salinispora mooreana TaxID=999545 RepID=UPI000372B4D4|nr:hypothetical protein [Salinispora mooreana]
MNHQHHTQYPDPPGRNWARSRRRWWAAGLAGVTGLTLTTTIAAASPAAGSVTHAQAMINKPTKPAADDRGGSPDSRRGEKPKGTPVPCDTDALIAAISLANARGGAILDLATGCTYLLTTDILGAGLPAVTSPITLNGGTHTTIERAAAADQFRILTVDTGGDLTLNKLKITGGHTLLDGGGGILVNPGGALTTNHSTITRNISGGNTNGGGIANLGTTRVRYSTVSHNTATDVGGGIASLGWLESTESTLDKNIGVVGGGLFAVNAAVSGGSISRNHAIRSGGLSVFMGASRVVGTRISENTADAIGGVGVEGGGQLTLRHVSLTDNTAQNVGGVFVQGGMGVDSDAVIEDSTIKGNSTNALGGGILNEGQTVLRRTHVIGNQADQGGGILNNVIGRLTLFTTKVVGNIAVTEGGGIVNQPGGTVDLNTATGTIVTKNRPENCINVTGCSG